MSNDVQWRHDMARSELVTGEAGEPGSVYREQGVTPGRDDPYLLELVTLDRPGGVATFTTLDRTPVAYGGTYRVVAVDGGAQITMGVWLRAIGRLRFVVPFMGKAVHANSTRYLGDLKVLLESR